MSIIIKEGFRVKDLVNVLMPKLHIDDYRSKLGSDDKNIVLSFIVNDQTAAQDLVVFLEHGYEFILEVTVSPIEITMGKYLVFVELKRRTRAIKQIFKILSDLKAACGHTPDEWKFSYMSRPYLDMTEQNLKNTIPLSPLEYRTRYNNSINEMRVAAGIYIKSNPVTDPELKALQFGAGI